MTENRTPTQIFVSTGRTVVRFVRNLFITAAALTGIVVIALLVTSALFPASFDHHSNNLDSTYRQIEKEISREQ